MKRIKKLVVLLMICLLTMAIPVSASAAEKISKKSVTLIKGQSTTLKVTGTKEKITWSSSKKSVATVSSKGKVVAKKTGTATITAKYGKKKLTCKVTVETPKISKTAVTLNVGKSYQLKMSGTKQKVKWTSSKSSVATVSSKGKVVGKKAGTATITATVGGKKYSCKVKVELPKISDKSLTVEIGEYCSIDVSGTTQTVKWTSSNKSVATVNSYGEINPRKAGTATITATVGGTKLTCKVTVKKKEILIESVSLDKSTLLLEVGNSDTLQVSISPNNTTEDKTVTWSSSDTDVVTVSNGIVTAKKAGTATITAEAGSKNATCFVQVNQSYGTVSGSVTWHYNQYKGYVADTNAKVFLVPKDGSASTYKHDNDFSFSYPSYSFMQELQNNYIYCAEVDGSGNYVINNVPIGEYITLIISHNSKGSAWFDAYDDSISDAPDSYYESIADNFGTCLNSSTALALAKSTIMYRYTFGSIVVQRNQNVTLSHAFPYTYI